MIPLLAATAILAVGVVGTAVATGARSDDGPVQELSLPPVAPDVAASASPASPAAAAIAPQQVNSSQLYADRPATLSGGEQATRGGAVRATPAPTSPTTTTTTEAPLPKSPQFSGCMTLDPAPVNQWRAALGRAPLTISPTLVAQSCAWSLEMAKVRRLSHGAYNEVVHYATASGRAFEAWRTSAAHYNLMVSSDPRVTQIGCGMVRAQYTDGSILHFSTCRMNY